MERVKQDKWYGQLCRQKRQRLYGQNNIDKTPIPRMEPVERKRIMIQEERSVQRDEAFHSNRAPQHFLGAYRKIKKIKT